MHQIAAFTFFSRSSMLALAFSPHTGLEVKGSNLLLAFGQSMVVGGVTVFVRFQKKTLLISHVLVRSLKKPNFTCYKCRKKQNLTHLKAAKLATLMNSN